MGPPALKSRRIDIAVLTGNKRDSETSSVRPPPVVLNLIHGLSGSETNSESQDMKQHARYKCILALFIILENRANYDNNFAIAYKCIHTNF